MASKPTRRWLALAWPVVAACQPASPPAAAPTVAAAPSTAATIDAAPDSQSAPAAATSPADLTAPVLDPERGGLLLVLDDIGFNRERVRRVLSWQRPVVFSILPGQPYSARIAAELAATSATIFLHQPMEPYGFPEVNPGARALLLAGTPALWHEQLERNLDDLPQAVGFNNHMGSRFSEMAAAATVIAEVAMARDLVFLDSLTSHRSKLYRACKNAGARCLARDVFLDDTLTAEAIDAQIGAWLRRAEKHGAAIAIAHPGPLTLARLEAALPDIDSRGLKFVSYQWMLSWQTIQEQH